MSDTPNEQAGRLARIVDRWGRPPADMIGLLPKGGTNLEFVGHADVNRILIDVDPMWTWEPMGYTPEGTPTVTVHNENAELWGWMTVLGKRLPALGSCSAKKPEVMKELISDLIRNGAMRFGICLHLWSKSEWTDVGPEPEPVMTTLKDAKQLVMGVVKFDKVAGKDLWDEFGPTGTGPFSDADLNPVMRAALEWTTTTRDEVTG